MRGFDMTRIIDLPVRAVVKEMAADEMITAAVNAVIEKSGKFPLLSERAALDDVVGSNQKPRMLQLTAWVAHAGPPNNNDRAFTEEDLKEAVDQGMFQAPYFGMIDFDHDFNAYGVWYSAEYAYDEKAGQWGIYAQGALFAWRYTDLSDKVLGIQNRQGYIDVSMGCMPGHFENAKTSTGRPYLIVRKPVFFTTSLLDVPPADPYARGLGSENPGDSSEDRTNELLQARASADKIKLEEAQMDELMQKIESALADLTEEREQFSVLVKAATEELPAVQATLTEVTGKLSTTEVEKAQLEARVKELEQANATLLEEKTATARLATDADETQRTVEVALEVANKELEAARATIEELETFKRTVEEERVKAETAAMREARMAQIPDAVIAALDEGDKEGMIEMWMAQDEESFARTVKLFSLAAKGTKRLSYVERSRLEGNLSTGAEGGGNGPEFDLIRKYRRT